MVTSTRGLVFIVALALLAYGWRMLSENIGSLRRRESMYDNHSAAQALWSGVLMAGIGLALFLAGLALIAYFVALLIL